MEKIESRTKSLYYEDNASVCFSSAINQVSVRDVQNAVSQALKTPLTLVAQGGEVNRIQSYDNISKIFN